MRSQMVGALAPSDSRPRPHLRARDLRKGFGDGAVLDGVTLTVTAGQRLAVIGENGAGKTTLLRLLAGRLMPDGGDVWCTTESRSLIEQEMDAPAGTTVASVHAEALRSPLDALAALEDAASGLAAGAEGAAEGYAAALGHAERLAAWDAEWRLEAALDAFDAHLHPERALASLSVGQRYRLRLGCALADAAGTVLLDEPSNHLDDSSLDRLVQWLVEFPGIVVFVTHDRWLLDAAATAIFDLDPALGAGGTLFGGSFPAYREARAGTLREWRRRYAAGLDAERELSKRLIAARAAAPGHWQPGKGAAKHGRESRTASSVRLLQRRIDGLRRERGPAPPDPLTFTAPDAADTGDTILLEATQIGVRGRVTQPSDSPIQLGARGRLLLRGANGAGKSTLLSVLASELARGHRHAHHRARCPGRAPRPRGRLESKPHARRRTRRVGCRSDPCDRTPARRRPRTPIRPAVGRAAPTSRARLRPAASTIGAVARRTDQPPLGHARRRTVRCPPQHASRDRSRHSRPNAVPHGPRLADTDPAERRRGAGAHPADLSSDPRSPTGPRCVSLSGLTIELMLLI